MAYIASQFQACVHAVGRARWHHYWTNDLATATDDADYFLSAYEHLRLGDWIFVSSDLDGTPLPQILMVTAATSSTVTTVVYPIGS